MRNARATTTDCDASIRPGELCMAAVRPRFLPLVIADALQLPLSGP